VRLILPQIKPVEEPVQLLTTERNRRARMIAGPFEAMFFKTFIPETESILFPVQNLKFVAATVNKRLDSNLKCIT